MIVVIGQKMQRYPQKLNIRGFLPQLLGRGKGGTQR